ncbi:MAG: hypothetical protein R2769_17035 [Saprospiraceae bacterium]
MEPGMRVIDACAGAGKKFTPCCLDENKGQIISMIRSLKLKELANEPRAQAFLIQGKENNKTIKRLEKSADRLLLDVPCTVWGY